MNKESVLYITLWLCCEKAAFHMVVTKKHSFVSLKFTFYVPLIGGKLNKYHASLTGVFTICTCVRTHVCQSTPFFIVQAFEEWSIALTVHIHAYALIN